MRPNSPGTWTRSNSRRNAALAAPTSSPRSPQPPIRGGPTALPDLVVEPQDVAAYRGTRLGDRLAGVSLVPRLRKPASWPASAGSSLPRPIPIPDTGSYGASRAQRFAEHATDDWLPGYQVFGEGILLVLDPDAVAAWEAKAPATRG